MPTLKGLAIAAIAVVASTSAVAATPKLTDVQYMAASRCAALIASPALGGGDASGIEALLKDQRQGRMDFIYEKSDELRQDAARQARHADGERKAKLIAERDGACQKFAGGSTAASAGAAASPHSAP